MNFKLECNPKELLQEILKLGLSGLFPTIVVALRISVRLSASVASGECTFNMLKQVKNYYCSTIEEDHLNGIAMLNIKCDLA
jgi:hypothetical protein